MPSHCQVWRRCILGLLLGAMMAVGMVGCESPSAQIPVVDPLGQRLVDLPLLQLPLVEDEPEPLSLEAVIQHYKAAMTLSQNVQLNQRIAMRITDLELKMIEDRMLDGAKPELSTLLQGQQQLVENVDVLGVEPERQQMLHYQLAKVYALDGRVKDSHEVLEKVSELGEYNQALLTEAMFRRAERAFNRGDYEEAEQFFREVVDGGASPFFDNAQYMLGWTQLKRADLEPALDSFIAMLDRRAAIDPSFETLSGSDAAIVDDVMRAMSIIFGYQGGGAGVAAAFAKRGPRTYEAKLYKHVADYFLGQRRYHDAAQTYIVFVGLYPFSEFAEPYTAYTVAIYRRGNFPRLAIEQKQFYLQRYGMATPYFKSVSSVQQQRIRGHLRDYMMDLVSVAHAQAQQAEPQGETETDVAHRFIAVADQYQRFVDTFPDDPQTPQMVYLMADAYLQAGVYPEAVAAYERAAYDYDDQGFNHRAADAGYGAVMMAREALEAHPDATAFWQLRKYDLSMKFAATYQSDPRVPDVQTDIAIDLLTLGRHDEAIRLADLVVSRQPSPSQETLTTAWRVLSQAQFEQQDYIQAEYALAEALVFLSPGTTAFVETEEKLAASIYQQAVAHQAVGELRDAAHDLLRIHQFTPAQPLAEKGHFDAINLLIDLESWSQAQLAADTFLQRYAASDLADALLAKQLMIYEAQENWLAAAHTLYAMYQRLPDRNVARDSLYLAAQYADKVGEVDTAIQYYRDYAHTFSTPLGLTLEAQYNLYVLYGKLQGKAYQQRYWLRKLIDSSEVASERDARADTLRATALLELGDYQRERFERITLTAPLSESLATKRQAMQSALRYYSLAMQLGLDEFSAKAHYYSAELYLQLSRDLLAAPKPKQLEALALAQYAILLEEQAYPLEEEAIAIHKANTERTRVGVFDQWVQASYQRLADILPVDYGKRERVETYVDELHDE